jgi:hypothetical protein
LIRNTGERPGDLVAGEGRGEDADALRDEQGTEPALHEPGGDEHAGVLGEPARERREREPGDPDQEHPPLAVPVTEAAAHDEQHTEGEGVAGAEPLDQRLPAADVAHDGGGGDVGDRGVHQVEDVGDQDDGEDGPQPPGEPGRVRRRPAGRVGDGHDVLPDAQAAPLIWVRPGRDLRLRPQV